MIEAGLMAFLGLVGMMLSARLANRPRTRMLHLALAFPIGSGAWVVVAAIVTMAGGRLVVPIGLCLLALPAILGSVWVCRKNWSARATRELCFRATILLAGIGVIVLVSGTLHMALATPDSIRYLTSADLFQESLDKIHPSDLVKRHFAYPALQAFAPFHGRFYLPSLGPLFGVSAAALVTAALFKELGHSKSRRQISILAVATLFFVASTNRLLYDVFYLNTHFLIATFLLIGVIALWWSDRFPELLIAVPVANAFIVLARPEGFFLALGLSLAAVIAVEHRTKPVWMVTVPMILGIAWYSVVIRSRVLDGTSLDPRSATTGSILALGAIALLGILRLVPSRATSRLIQRLPLLTYLGLLALLVVAVIKGPHFVDEVARPTITNVLSQGAWSLAWPILAVMIPLSILSRSVRDSRIWTIPMLVFFLSSPLLPLLREGSYRVGAGDSGNRILAHIALVAITYVSLALGASSQRSAIDGSTPG